MAVLPQAIVGQAVQAWVSVSAATHRWPSLPLPTLVGRARPAQAIPCSDSVKKKERSMSRVNTNFWRVLNVDLGTQLNSAADCGLIQEKLRDPSAKVFSFSFSLYA